MKRKEAPSKDTPSGKKHRPSLPEYHATPSLKDESGDIIWPAPKDQLATARAFIGEAASSGKTVLFCPDKDADGLSSGAILYRTLTALGLSPDLIKVHLLEKGTTVHSESEREDMAAEKPSYIVILDQGSRSGPSVIDDPNCKSLIIDHHYATDTDFPRDSLHVTACQSPPVATSSLLTYTICRELHPSIAESTAWLCVIGTHGDLGNTLKWESPFPDMKDTFKQHKKKLLKDAVSLLNAPRRTASFNVIDAWTALIGASGPKDIVTNTRLLAARAEVNDEVERCTHTAPRFSLDGSVAVFRIHSAAQVHPVIATRWSGHLSSSKLEFVMVANDGYKEGKVSFSCRVARSARAAGKEIDIIARLKEWADRAESGDLRERMGDDFARGHVQASGGVVSPECFDELMRTMRVGEKPEKTEEVEQAKGGHSPTSKTKTKQKEMAKQSNKLTSYFAKG